VLSPGLALKAGVVATARVLEQRLRGSAALTRAVRDLVAGAARRRGFARDFVRLRIMRIF
jgi:hypothetical protein